MNNDNDGVCDRKEVIAKVHRIRLKLNRHGVARALHAAGLIPEGFYLTGLEFPDAYDDDQPELNSIVLFTVERETPA